MRLADSLISWHPSWMDASGGPVGTSEQVRVERRGQHGASPLRYRLSDGGCRADVQRMKRKAATAYVIVLFNTLVLRDGMNPAAVHRELLKIAEYRRGINLEVDGAEASTGAVSSAPERQLPAPTPSSPPDARCGLGLPCHIPASPEQGGLTAARPKHDKLD